MFSSRQAHRSDALAVLNAIDRSLAIIEFDPAGTILTANANFLAVMGYSLAEIAGRHHSIFVAPDYAKSDAYRAFWAKLGRGEFDTQEYRRVGKGGRDVWIQASYNPVRTRRGRVKKIVKIASDVTPARLANADFQGKLAAISRVQAVIEFTPAGEIIMANENFLNTLGYRLEEVRGKHHSIFVEPAYGRSRDYRDFWAKLNAGEFIAAEFKRIGKAGNDVWIQASYNPIFDLNGKVSKIVKFATDVTQRVRAVDAIGDGLSQLAHNNLEHRLEQAFDPAFEKLRHDYNQSLRGLQATIVRVTETASSISTGTQQIAASSDDMSRRAEQQAASLEETAAALDEITGTVKRSAEVTKLAATAASDAKAGATRSGLVMNEAAAAMGEIAQSSEKITQIIGLIDEIAFQTNLLALNAGVEAARAGETGRGFAVVAQEVRGLAQRSAKAAKEIKSLIATSSGGVKRGVRLVSETAESLTVISTKVAEIDALISDIATAAQEQVTGLSHVNSAVNQMDQATQQNAAMIEESAAAAAGLKTEAAGMAELMGQFRVELVRTPQVGIGSVKLRLLEPRRASAATHPAETKYAASVRQAE